METLRNKPDYVLWGLIVLLLLAVGSTGYLWYEREQLKVNLDTTIANFTTEMENKNADLAVANTRITELNDILKQVKDELEELEDDYRDEKSKNDNFEDRINDITGTVRDLDKLSKTDEELLQKYSKVYFLNENYVPSDLDKIPNKYVQDGKDPLYFHGDAVDFLEDMLDAANRAGHDLKIVSAYRSFDEQTSLKGQFTTVYGSGANTFSADQGYSEHQLGTTVDLTTPEVGGTDTSFAETEAYEWLTKNAYKYGFTLSYPENNGFYIFEPWHWRFVGEDLAEDLYDDDAHFYDWDQRKIDEYLIKIFD